MILKKHYIKFILKTGRLDNINGATEKYHKSRINIQRAINTLINNNNLKYFYI